MAKRTGNGRTNGQKALDQIRDLLSQPDAAQWVANYIVRPRRPLNVRYANSRSRRYYRGINWLILSLVASARLYGTDYWMTYRQARKLGGHVRKGERGTLVVLWKFNEIEEVNEETGEMEKKNRTLMRVYYVFNLAQTEGVDIAKAENEYDDEMAEDFEMGAAHNVSPLERVAQVLQEINGAAEIMHLQTEVPRYTPKTDQIVMLPPSQFTSMERYMITKMHEVAHSTGHPKRLNRPGFARMIEENTQIRHERGMEEMTAELASTMLAAEFGIELPDLAENASRYVRHWQGALDDSQKGESLLTAAQNAQKAVDYILRGGDRVSTPA